MATTTVKTNQLPEISNLFNSWLIGLDQYGVDAKFKLTDIKGDLKGVATPSFDPGVVPIASYWVASTAGTYTHMGNVVVNPSSLAIISWSGTAWAITQTTVTMSDYLAKTEVINNLTTTDAAKALSAAQGNLLDIKTPEPWTAKAWTSGKITFYRGRTWQSTAATLSTDIPGISTLWTEISKRSPFVAGSAADGNALTRNAIIDIEFFNPTVGEEFYHYRIGNNYTGATNHFGAISTVNPTDFIVPVGWASANVTSGNVALTGVVTYMLKRLSTGDKFPVGRVIIDWDKIPNGSNYFESSPVSGNSKYLPSARKPYSVPAIQSKNMFSVNSTFNVEYPDIFAAIERIELYNADLSKRYYLKSFGRNYNSTNKWYFIIEQEGNSSSTGVCYANSALVENVNGVNVLTLNTSGSQGITGKAWVNFTKVTSTTTASFFSFTIGQTELTTEIHVKPEIFTKGYFAPNSTINQNYPDIFKAIQKIELYGADPTKRYWLRYFGRNYNSTNKWYFIIEQEGHDYLLGVCYYNAALTEVSPGVTVITLAAGDNSGITGKVWINYSLVTTVVGTNYITYTLAAAELSSQVHVSSAGGNLPFSEATDRLILANDLYLVDKDNLQLCKNSIISSEYYPGKLGIQSESFMSVFADWFDYNITLRNDRFSDNTTVRIFNKMYNNATMYYKNVNIHKVPTYTINAATAELFMFGDSITDGSAGVDRPIAPYVASNIINDWLTAVTFRGLKVDSTYKNEGRASWEYAILIGLRTQYSTTVYMPTDANTALNDVQPFIKLATSQQIIDHPTWCFENTPSTNSGVSGKSRELNYTESHAIGTYTGQYYTFDFARYVSLNIGGINMSKKLLVTCAMGFNDMNHNSESEQAKADVLLGMDIFATRVKEFNPAAKIGFIPVVIVNEDNVWPQYANLIELAIKKATALSCDIIPVWQHVDRYSAFDYGTTVDLSADNNSKIGTTIDHVHPTSFGAKQYANAVSNWIANKL